MAPFNKYAWDEERTGALEVDLAEHSDRRGGHHAHTLSVVDVVSGRSHRKAVMGKSQAVVFKALHEILQSWPNCVRAIHGDNGSEFFGQLPIKYCRAANTVYHRSRSYQKDNKAHVEQKNRQYVHEIIGYERIDNQYNLNWLNPVYRQLDTYANLFLPSLKLIEEARDGRRALAPP